MLQCENNYKCDLMDRIQEAILAISADIDRAEKMAEEAEARGDKVGADLLRNRACALNSALETLSWCGIPFLEPMEDEEGTVWV